MGKTIMTIEQTGSPIRRHRSQRALAARSPAT